MIFTVFVVSTEFCFSHGFLCLSTHSTFDEAGVQSTSLWLAFAGSITFRNAPAHESFEAWRKPLRGSSHNMGHVRLCANRYLPDISTSSANALLGSGSPILTCMCLQLSTHAASDGNLEDTKCVNHLAPTESSKDPTPSKKTRGGKNP